MVILIENSIAIELHRFQDTLSFVTNEEAPDPPIILRRTLGRCLSCYEAIVPP